MYTRSAGRDLERLSRVDQKRILDKLDYYAAQPEPLHFAKPLTGYHGFFRFHVGGHRVITHSVDDVLYVHMIEQRKSVYRKL